MQGSVNNLASGTIFVFLGCAMLVGLWQHSQTAEGTRLVKTLAGIAWGSGAGITLSYGGVMLSVQFSAIALVHWFGWALVVSGCTLAIGLVTYAFARYWEASRP